MLRVKSLEADLTRACCSWFVPQRVAALPANLGISPNFSIHNLSRPSGNMLQSRRAPTLLCDRELE